MAYPLSRDAIDIFRNLEDEGITDILAEAEKFPDAGAVSDEGGAPCDSDADSPTKNAHVIEDDTGAV